MQVWLMDTNCKWKVKTAKHIHGSYFLMKPMSIGMETYLAINTPCQIHNECEILVRDLKSPLIT